MWWYAEFLINFGLSFCSRFNPQTPAIAQTETTKSVCPLKQKRGRRDAQFKSSAQNQAPAQRS